MHRLKSSGIRPIVILLSCAVIAIPLSATLAQSRDPATAAAGLEVEPGLEVALFASEPDLLSPSSIDVDHRGRVWVCEIVNYRQELNAENETREEGDRILILEDTDADGLADKQTVFYQGRDIDSPHGVCVLGDRVLVSAGKSVFSFIDADGDDVPEKKELLFTGIGGSQHDHGIHTFIFGPDGKLYFNFGNNGFQLKDKNGQPVTDMAGNLVDTKKSPYLQGLVFRCNLDGSEVETLAWNFRNNWELCLDSFGTIWQSDNDDDGHRATRLNFVMEFGNYGYQDELTSGSWRDRRVGMHETDELRHWHLRDPGVVPNLIQTGAGSPCGICFYEGDLLPPRFQHQIVHCDPGVNEVRRFPTEIDGAGYTARQEKLLRGTIDKWFRPTDVCVAPDGSLIVADWYDPGVGGHRMGDQNRGRIFRIAPPGTDYSMPEIDTSTTDGVIAAINSPNLATRYLAWHRFRELAVSDDTQSKQKLNSIQARLRETFDANSKDQASSYRRARVLWMLGNDRVASALTDSDPDIRIAAIRLARQLKLDIIALLENQPESEPRVNRERAIALRHVTTDQELAKARMWAKLAAQYDGQDRWYLEALGIGAGNAWDACLAAYLPDEAAKTKQLATKAGRMIVWRSRSSQTLPLIIRLLRDPNVPMEEVHGLLRAIAFLQPDRDDNSQLLRDLVADRDAMPSDRRALVTLEVAAHLPDSLRNDESMRAAIDDSIDSIPGTVEFVSNVATFRLRSRYADLLKLVTDHPGENVADQAIQVLARQAPGLIDTSLNSDDAETAMTIAKALGKSADGESLKRLAPLLASTTHPIPLRIKAVAGIIASPYTSAPVLDLARAGKLDPRLHAATASLLHGSSWLQLRDAGAELFPMAAAQDDKPVPPIVDLIERVGDAEHGRQLYGSTATCSKCHVVNGVGTNVGPDLSEIGDKLSREALYHSILFPSAGISHNYETFHLELDNGTIAVGLVLSETDDAVTIKNDAGAERTIPRDTIEEMTKQDVSLMPSNLHQLFTTDDLVDLVTYLESLKKTRAD